MAKIPPAREKIYEGSSKILYETEEGYALIQFFKDDQRLISGEVAQIAGKGIIKNNISAFIMDAMALANIPTHLIEKINMREQLIQVLDMIPVQVCVSNIACGRYVTEFGIEEGYVFDHPMIDFRVKNSEYGNPVTSEHQMIGFGWTYEEEIKELKTAALRVSDFLTGLFAGVGIRMVECQLEFGRTFDGDGFMLMLADEVTPDSCRLWDLNTNKKLDFEHAFANPEEAIAIYKEVAKRLKIT
jgi:phosphoribosylaminoimidazole-succinocarboxamide synthase